jgi:hypothetical protein
VDQFDTMKLTSLELVYPPISNQEAVWIEKDPAVEQLLRQSDLYMISGRAEMKFEDFTFIGHSIEFTVTIGDTFSDTVCFSPLDLPTLKDTDPDTVEIELGPKLIRIWDGPAGGNGSNVLDWFTTEKLIHDRSRGVPGIDLFEKYLIAGTYDLLYVGIAKVGDTFDRLIRNGHKARMNILANEPQRYPGARVTDEIYLLMFKAHSMTLTVFGPEHEFKEGDLGSAKPNMKRVVADAEKAFVSALNPTYNTVRFKQYPRGKDGVYSEGYKRYGYQIRENLVFRTAHGVLHGGRDILTGHTSSNADGIFADGDTVTFLEGNLTASA